MKSLVIAALALISVKSFAADETKTIVCAGTLNSGTYAELTVQTTAIPTYLKAELAIDYREFTLDMNCTRSADLSYITCTEVIPGGNKLKALIANGKAQITQETDVKGFELAKGALVCK